jgi:16S rRNA (guanine966-N2)-methyltransferase
MFASLGSLGAVEGARVLDLFAGTGALGIEALSRGACHATFVDDDGAAISAIRANLSSTGLDGVASVIRGDVLAYLDVTRDEFDLVLADPPYAFDGWHALVGHLPAPLAALESGRPVDPGARWEIVRTRRYGDTTVTIIRRRD